MKKRSMFRRVCASLACVSLVGGMLVGCGTSSDSSDSASSDSTSSEEPVELLWYVGGNGAQADTDAVLEVVNEYLLEKLNCTLKIVENDFGSHTEKMKMVISGQETYDLCFTSSWSNDFSGNAAKNAYYSLDELLEEYGQDLLELIPEAAWEATTLNGEIYAVPNMQIWAKTDGMAIVASEVEALGFSFDESEVYTLEDMEPFLAAYKEANPDSYPIANSSYGILSYMSEAMGYDELVGTNLPGVVMLDDDTLTAVNQYELPQVYEHYETMYEWNQLGYFREDAATVSDYTADLAAGRHISRALGTIKPGMYSEVSTYFGGVDYEVVPTSEAVLTTAGITGTLTAISRTSENPEKAMEFLNLLNTDEYLYNLITKGIEGVHYEMLEDGHITFIENSGYMPSADWMYGNQFLAYLSEDQEDGVWEETMELNETAVASPAMGFIFDSTNVQNEMASVSAVKDEYHISFDTGSLDPAEYYDEFLEKLEQAGSQVIVDELQRQLDEWSAANQ